MKWEKIGQNYRIVYKGYECIIRPFGADQWAGYIASHAVEGYSYRTAPFSTVEGACKRCLEVVDAR